jgi:ribosomal protein S18 acetylase RimI-like enzyme
MITQVDTHLRRATSTDKQKIANLIHFGTYIHRHLDWRNPLDWINHQPYVILEKGKIIQAALACPPDPPEISWIRLFAVDDSVPMDVAWEALWAQSLRQLTEKNVRKVAVIPLHDWFLGLVYRNRFTATIRVITMTWKSQFLPPPKRINSIVTRPMTVDDLEEIVSLDAAAFNPLWCNSRSSIEIAFRQAAIASVVDLNGCIAGYQISTSNQMGGHLARLAIHPKYQGLGVGYNLLYEVLNQFERRGTRQVSVNTQEDNFISLNLYEKAGFVRTGEEYQVFELALASA